MSVLSLCTRLVAYMGIFTLLLLSGCALSFPLQGQTDGRSLVDSLRGDDGWEAYLESQLHVGLLTEEEVHAAHLLYEELKSSPLDINTVNEEELSRIPMLSEYQIYQFVYYRIEHRAFHELSELKLVPGWSLSLIDLLRPVFTCHPKVDDTSLLGNTLYASHEATLFYGRRSYPSAEMKPLLGESDALRLSYSYTTPRRLSLFLAGEKDYGEPWRMEGHRGFDAYSFHAQLQYRAMTLVLGDYRVARGCGLLLSQGAFPLSFLSLTPHQGSGVRPVRSMTETDFSRGAACTATFGAYRLGLFASQRKMDAHRGLDGTLSALSEIGLHTTEAQWRMRAQATSRLYGGWLEYRTEKLNVSLQGMMQDWQGDRLMHPPGSQGDVELAGLQRYSAYSLSYSYQAMHGHLRLSGELACRDRSAWAVMHHFSYLQGRWADIRLSLWRIGEHYWSYYGRAGTHALRPHHEDGGRIQLQLTPFASFTSTLLYCDAYRSYALRRGEDVLNQGVNYGMMTTLQLERNMSLSLHYRGRKGSHRIKLEGRCDLGLCEPRLALLYARGANSSGWGMQSAVRWLFGERMQVDCFADFFHAPSWEGRLYTLKPMLRGEYGATLLYGEGVLLGARVRCKLTPHWQVEGRIQYEHQNYTTRPTKSLVAFVLRYRDW